MKYLTFWKFQHFYFYFVIKKEKNWLSWKFRFKKKLYIFFIYINLEFFEYFEFLNLDLKKNWPNWFNYTKTVNPEILQMVSKVAPCSPLNIGQVKWDGIIITGNCIKKARETQGNLENHITLKYNKEFKNFVLKLLCFGHINHINYIIQFIFLP